LRVRGERGQTLQSIAVASSAGGRRRLIKQDGLSVHVLEVRVTGLTAHIFMRALQGKYGFFMVECRGTPLCYIVTIRAEGGSAFFLDELWAMDVLMAVLALCGCLGVVHILQGPFHVRRAVAAIASYSLVGSQKVKLGT